MSWTQVSAHYCPLVRMPLAFIKDDPEPIDISQGGMTLSELGSHSGISGQDDRVLLEQIPLLMPFLSKVLVEEEC